MTATIILLIVAILLDPLILLPRLLPLRRA